MDGVGHLQTYLMRRFFTRQQSRRLPQLRVHYTPMLFRVVSSIDIAMLV
jgi:hypothetical protein